MTDENARVPRSDFWRWTVLGLLLLASLITYFILAPRVPPAIRPAQNAETP